MVAVSGATGLIGSRLVQQLLAAGFTVRVLTRDPAAARAKLPHAGLEFFRPPQWAEAIHGAAAVVNLAGGGGECCCRPDGGVPKAVPWLAVHTNKR